MSLSKPTAQAVIDLTGSDIPAPVVESIIDDAAIIGRDCLSVLDAETQEAALKWLTAHLIASTDSGAQLSSEKLGDASETYVRAQVKDGIAGTVYGQQAIAIAPCLARVGRARARITVV